MNSTVPSKIPGQTLSASEVNNIVSAINSKQDAEAGKGLSTNDYTNAEKTKLAGIASGATTNSSDTVLLNRMNHTGTQSADTLTDGTIYKVFTATERTKLAGIAAAATLNDTDANLRDRSTHTGTQLASTISDFATAVLGALPDITGESGKFLTNNGTGLQWATIVSSGGTGIGLTDLSATGLIAYDNITGQFSTAVNTGKLIGRSTAGIGQAEEITLGSGLSLAGGILAVSITQYTDALARGSISITTSGSSGAATYNATTGVLNIPQYAAATWGNVTGSLSSQTDLQTALNAKVSTNIAITGASKTKITYDSKGLVTGGSDATTTDIAEGSNQYYTNARARAALSITNTGTSGNSTYNSTTGVINIPNYTVVLDSTPTNASSNSITSGAVYTALAGKDDRSIGTKTSHGFGVGWSVYRDASGIWQRSNGDANDLESRGDVIIQVIDANTFVVGKPGTRFDITGLGLTSDTPYYLAITTTNTPNYTSTAPSTVGNILREVFYTTSATEAVVSNTDTYEIATASTGGAPDPDSVTNAMLATDVKVGSLAALTTTTKSSVQAAINELKSAIDGIVSSSGGTDPDYVSLPPLTSPGSFAATPASSSQNDLTWTDTSGELNYKLQRSTVQTSGYSTITSPVAGATSYSDTGLVGGTTYYYRLKAIGNGWTTRDSQWVFTSATTSAGGGATVEQEILLNFLNQYRDENEYSGVQGINDVGGTAVSGGTAAKSAVKDINGSATAVNFALTSAGIGAASSPANGADPSSDSVFGKEFVAGISWHLSPGGTFKLSGLAASRTYKLYFWSNSFAWESAVVNFTANGVTSTDVTSGNNYGSAAGDPLLDSALRLVTCTSDGSGEINVTANYVSGFSAVPLTALYIQRMSA